MDIVVIGGGKVGYYLAKTLLSYHHRVKVIEIKRNICEKIADELNIPVYNGDATKVDVLKNADVSKADIFIAVTGLDEENLIACQLAKNNLRVGKTIARVNNPKNTKVFLTLGVDIPVSSTTIIADIIEEEVDYAGMKTIKNIKNNKLIISEIEIKKTSPVFNKKVKDIKIPKDCMLASIIKNEEVLRPSENLVLLEGDSVIVISDHENKRLLRDLFVGASE
ncbi:NAD-binding protein [Sinanaerobacter chloroacetimidivorans]|jgi:trk system potassium uptake protein TrkA|uniref:Trk system potassium uptake protein TrkA n=1 Tax=Sinanaerobacter chloroacetimidivorans TaxID=2818044 RepID=A0A8J7W143_9FIRM|nr:NAD-binding protein [Sinanaerobacter chloroacetimidivorans]MBR0597020.1 NAD-binding protein [Sinanaerobacter chloroacetimidivorans]